MITHVVPQHAEPGPARLMHTVLDAARILRVGRSTIYVLMNNGSLRAVHIGRAVRISHAELERYVECLDARRQSEAVDNGPSPTSAAQRRG